MCVCVWFVLVYALIRVVFLSLVLDLFGRVCKVLRLKMVSHNGSILAIRMWDYIVLCVGG
jgi:hypothetical protein